MSLAPGSRAGKAQSNAGNQTYLSDYLPQLSRHREQSPFPDYGIRYNKAMLH